MSTGADGYNQQLLNRQIEINEWQYQNRMETLFVFQILFICLMIVAIIMYLRRVGLFGGLFAGYAIALLILVFIIIIMNRSMYTNRVRDKQYWSKRTFDQDNQLASPAKMLDQAYLDALRTKYGTPPPDACAACKAQGRA